MRTARTLSLIWLLASVAGGLSAQTGGETEGRATLSYASRHVFRGIERAGPSAQVAADYSLGNFRAGLWMNQPFAGGAGREADLTVAWARTSGGGITLGTSGTLYWYPGVRADETRRSVEGGLMATFAPVGGFTPSVGYSRDFRLRADQVQVGVRRSIALTSLGAFLDLDLFAGQVSGDDWRPDAPGPRRRDSYRYWGVEGHLPYRIGPHSTLIAGLHYAGTDGLGEIYGPTRSIRRQNLWLSLGVSLDF